MEGKQAEYNKESMHCSAPTQLIISQNNPFDDMNCTDFIR